MADCASAIRPATSPTVSSWGHHYDSLTLFSPARYSSLPGLPFGGDGDRYPHRDEVVDYLARHARDLGRGGAEIHTGARVTAVEAGLSVSGGRP